MAIYRQKPITRHSVAFTVIIWRTLYHENSVYPCRIWLAMTCFYVENWNHDLRDNFHAIPSFHHLRSTLGIICSSGSFVVQFGDHFRSGDHLRSGIICGAVQVSLLSLQGGKMRDPGNKVALAFARARIHKESKGPKSQLILVMVNFHCVCYCWSSEPKGKEKNDFW